ncbi:MAG: hypothetical protein CMJ59_13025 [Planctomycetaceae bacterium]|nr:hypothetical protein [Planctomycetaceae bacterium]
MLTAALTPFRAATEQIMSKDTTVLFCDRCLTTLTPGSGDFFQVHIRAVADPSPPEIVDSRPVEAIRQEIKSLLNQMENLSAQEAMDQVYRRVTIHLCNSCFHDWIEQPAGR